MKRKIALWCVIVFTVIFQARMPVHAENPYGNVYCRNTKENKRIALTFDDGPHPRFTEDILSILEEYGVTATFFVIGVNATRYPDSLKKIVDSGCEIANHTYSHRRIDHLREAEMRAEIQRCEETLYEMTGIRSHLFRPPCGLLSDQSRSVMKELNYDVVLWSIDTLDWAHTPSSKIAEGVLAHVIGGDIILMHDYVSGKNTTCEALRMFIPKLLEQGYEFVTVSELIQGGAA